MLTARAGECTPCIAKDDLFHYGDCSRSRSPGNLDQSVYIVCPEFRPKCSHTVHSKSETSL